MDKVIKILEKHVQWLTLTLAVLWASWQGYSYLANEPVKAQVGTKEVTPATIDQVIRDGSIKHLEALIASKEIKPPQQPKVLELVQAGIGELDANPKLEPSLSGGAPHGRLDSGGSGTNAPKDLVAEVPNPLPAAIPDANKITTRWTVISVPAANQPAPAAGAAPGVPVQPVMLRQDTAYFSAIFTVDSAALTKEFDRCYSHANVPLNMLVSEFTRVELLREEKKPDGTWSAPVIVPTLPIWTIMPDPRDQKPGLSTDKLKIALYDYKAWFEQNQPIIKEPPFYQTAADAEAWVPPGTAPVEVVAQPGQAVVAPVRPFDPTRDAPRTPAEIAQKNAYEASLRAARAARSRTPVRPGGGPPTGGYSPPPGYLVRPGGGPPVGGNVYPGNNNAVPQLINPNQGFRPNAAPVGLPGQDIPLLVHDTSIQEGKTYRYAVRYRLFNPMWDHPESAKPAVAATFDIHSPDATDPQSIADTKKVDPKFDAEKLWTPEIKVEPRAHIFVTKMDIFSVVKNVDFIIFSWKDGKWKDAPAKKLVAGDVIMANKVPTVWTVVDVRKDTHTGQAYVILMDDHGVLTRRDEASDSQSPELQKLKAETGAAASAR